MAIEVKSLPEKLPDTLPCPTRGYLVVFYATASGSSKDPSSIGEATAKQRAEDHEVALTAAVARKADQWRPKCKEGCKGRIRIVSGPDHDTVTHPILDPRHHVDVVGWEATLTVWEVVSAACVPSPG